MRMLSLFSGIGGIDLAAQWAGVDTVAFVEIDQYCQRVLAKHWPGVPIFGDIHDVTAESLRVAGVGDIDIVAGGFPCQPHSVAGRRQASGDERDLWPEFARCIREFRPRWVVGENVPGLLSSESGAFFGTVLRDLAALGYDAGWGVWGACDVGAMHRRERVFIVAHAHHSERGTDAAAGGGSKLGRFCDSVHAEWQESASRSAERGEALPNSDNDRRRVGENKQVQLAGSSGASDTRFAGEAMAHACRTGRQERDAPAQPSRPGYAAVGDVEVANADELLQYGAGRSWHGRAESTDGCQWQLKPVMGGTAHGLPARLVRPVAAPGEVQYPWEAPRTVSGKVPDRAKKLKALGNAVVPQQIYPLFAAIVAAESESA